MDGARQTKRSTPKPIFPSFRKFFVVLLSQFPSIQKRPKRSPLPCHGFANHAHHPLRLRSRFLVPRRPFRGRQDPDLKECHCQHPAARRGGFAAGRAGHLRPHVAAPVRPRSRARRCERGGRCCCGCGRGPASSLPGPPSERDAGSDGGGSARGRRAASRCPWLPRRR